MAVYIRMKK